MFLITILFVEPDQKDFYHSDHGNALELHILYLHTVIDAGKNAV